ncbi:DUF3800 domain-containing protein [Chitiniphilus eburneus]|uniref:DUF3800 domain-containing protein n=1 Tax=Chitiniphilus eburneus TaxID=2571148 RepID=A0A4U0Q8M1_9NEIS|nr:DUF3800 domain-containing protein [Chitiniphilus eburneus]TJZ77535.1 hypothetical protein FAZ21_04185 [Chitiniphilus eburneus]
MHIAIDDTYGPEMGAGSSFVTSNRRTHVAVVFLDEEVQNIRKQTAECLAEIDKETGVKAKEFHFVDIYNRKPPWDKIKDQVNLRIFEFFASIYRRYQWPIFIQTIDDRTLGDHDIGGLVGKIEGLDLSDRADLSLLLLLLKLKNKFKEALVPITLFLDEGREKPGTAFGLEIFHDWPVSFNGCYSSSAAEPLLQIADFIAFCINRSTHLALKRSRSDVDAWFLNLVGEMRINCDDLKLHKLPRNFSIDDFDGLHMQDRAIKGL